MSNQGFYGALSQFWTINDKPRLDRRNTYFEDNKIGVRTANCLWVVFTILALAMALSMVVSCL